MLLTRNLSKQILISLNRF